MAGELSEGVDFDEKKLPKGYRLVPLYDRQTIVCKTCGMRWWADRMTHWANEIFLVQHRDAHSTLRRKLPRNLPEGTRRLLPKQDAS